MSLRFGSSGVAVVAVTFVAVFCLRAESQDSESHCQSYSSAESKLPDHRLGAPRVQSLGVGQTDELVQAKNADSRQPSPTDGRLIVWKRINELAQRPLRMSEPAPVISKFQLSDFRGISLAQLNPSWSEYLKLNQVRAAFQGMPIDNENQKESARQTLARIYSPALSRRQSEYVQQVFDSQVISFLKSHAIDKIDYQDLLSDLERYETRPSGFNASRLNDHYQNLFWSADIAE
jgi:hypothetical protein